MKTSRLVCLLLLIPLLVLPWGCRDKGYDDTTAAQPGGTDDPGVSTGLTPSPVTQEVLEELTRGQSDDFQGMSQRLAAVLSPQNQPYDAFLLKSITDFLAFARRTAMDPTPSVGKLKDLLDRMGYRNKNDLNGQGSFWRFDLEIKPGVQGQFAANAPGTAEIAGYLDTELKGALLNLIQALAQIPSTFAYTFTDLTVDRPAFGRFFRSARPVRVEIDYGDVKMLQTTLELMVAFVDFMISYEDGNLALNDFDSQDPHTTPYDPLGLIVSKYPGCGTIRGAGRFTAARDRVKTAFQCYQAAAQHILNETAQQQQNGLITIDPSKFSTPAERTRYLNAESFFRTQWFPSIMNAFATQYKFTHGPDGTPVNHTVTVDFGKFWNGVNLRTNFLKTVIDPLGQETEFGVTDILQLTSNMYTVGQVLVSVDGRAPAPGDLQNWDGLLPLPTYAVRVDTPLTGTKTIDGQLGEWVVGVNCTRVATTPVLGTNGVDLGDVLVARDAQNLYLAVNRDWFAHLQTWGDSLGIGVEDSTYSLYFYGYYSTPNPGLGHHFSSPYPPQRKDPTYVRSSTGLEIAIPIQNFPGNWVEVYLEISCSGPTRAFDDVARGPFYIKIR